MLALYFLLAGMIGRFRYLRPALAAILVFIGLKMAGTDFYQVPVVGSLAVIVSILAAATVASVCAERRERGHPAALPSPPLSRISRR
jgi:tellurite resistance protein TerC